MFNAPGGDRTHDHKIKSRKGQNRSALENKPIPSDHPIGRTTGRTGEQDEGGVPDSDLARLVGAWPSLPEQIRAAMLALVTAAAGAPPVPAPRAGASRLDDHLYPGAEQAAQRRS